MFDYLYVRLVWYLSIYMTWKLGWLYFWSQEWNNFGISLIRFHFICLTDLFRCLDHGSDSKRRLGVVCTPQIINLLSIYKHSNIYFLPLLSPFDLKANSINPVCARPERPRRQSRLPHPTHNLQCPQHSLCWARTDPPTQQQRHPQHGNNNVPTGSTILSEPTSS